MIFGGDDENYYFDWIFFSAYFLKHIVNALDTGEEARSIFTFILVCGAMFFCINLYRDYVENVVVPLTDAKLYHGVYLRLYRKARNVELRCYENLVTKHLSLAELTVMTSLMVSATWILIDLFEDIMNMIKNGMFIRNLRTFLEYREEIPEDQDGIVLTEPFETLEFDHVSFSYQKEETIRDLCFTIRRGESVALVGHNGAGKSTIIKLMLRLYDPTEGVIRLNGVDIRQYNLRSYRKLFATAFQDVCLFGMTVEENILLGEEATPEREARVIDALKKAGVYERIQKLPQGIHTMMTKEFDEDGAVLSGGESQKVAVARAFYRSCPVKIFDEPSSALDPIAEYQLNHAMLKMAEHRTVIFISHRLSTTRLADRIILMENGQIREQGTHEDLLAAGGIYARMWKVQASQYMS